MESSVERTATANTTSLSLLTGFLRDGWTGA